jgi:hypothetical protein
LGINQNPTKFELAILRPPKRLAWKFRQGWSSRYTHLPIDDA